MSSTRRTLIAVTLTAASFAVVYAQAVRESVGTIEGRITVPANDDITEEILRGRLLNRYGAHELHRDEQVQPYRLSEKAVIYLEGIEEEEAEGQSSPRPQLNQNQMMFRPLVLPVTAGTTVDFPNNDNLYHNVFSYSHPREFDLGRYPTGQKKSVTFDRPGVVKVYCDIHSYMYATILVLRNHYYALPDEEGLYRITDIPEGSYTLVFWYGRKVSATKHVAVKAGATTTVDFIY